MSEAQVQSTASGAIVFDPTPGFTPDDNWFERAYWFALGKVSDQAGGRGGVSFVDTPVGTCALRHYHRGGLAARLSADRYVWIGAARTRAFREFRLLAQLLDLGLPVPAPIAGRYVREGLRYRADLLTRRIERVQTLADRLASGTLDASLAPAMGSMIARFHAAGVWHADLNAHNILVDADGAVWLIDFDRGRLRKPALAWQHANLARLRRSLDKLGAKRSLDFDARFWHPMLAAYHDGMSRERSTANRAGTTS